MPKQNAHKIWALSSWLLAALAYAALSACSSVDEHAADAFIGAVALHNPSEFARVDEPVYLSFYDLGLLAGATSTPILMVENGNVIPVEQVDTDGDGRKDSLFTVLDFAPGERRSFRIQHRTDRIRPLATTKRTQAEISIKEGGQWREREDDATFKEYVGGSFKNATSVTTPEFYTDHSNWIRYEGPGIESDKVGYRVYLDWRNGFDIFGKKTAEPVLQHIGQDGYQSYHEPQPWGMDLLKVGDTLGIGGFGYWDGEQVIGLKDVESRTATVRDNGNLRASVGIQYQGWRVADTKLDAKAYLSMTAGSRLVHNRLSISGTLANLAVGIANHPNTEFIAGDTEIASDMYTYLATWGPQSLAGDELGLAVFFKKRDLETIVFDGKSRIAVLTPARGQVDYYFAAAWAGELNGEGITDQAAFEAYLDKTVKKLNRGLRRDLDTVITAERTRVPLSKAQALYWAQAMADSELARKANDYRVDGWDENRKRPPKFEYDIVGVLPLAYDELGELTGEARYKNVKNTVTASYVGADGAIARYSKENFNIDAIAPGPVLLRLYDQTGELRFKLAAERLREQLKDQPRTANGAFWHKQRYPGQLWLDGVYMGMPFLSEYTTRYENSKALDEVINEFKVTRSILRDPETGLYYHAWDEYKKQDWADPKTGLSSHFWARGIGWMAMALVDVLDQIPTDHTESRAFLIDMTVELAQALKRYQDPKTGVWWQIMNKPGATGNYPESSATAMFSYFLTKAVARGYLTDATFGGDVEAFARNAFESLIAEFTLVHPDGKISMTHQCHVAGLGFGRDGSYDYYMDEPVVANDPKGTGPFILAAVQMARFLDAQ